MINPRTITIPGIRIPGTKWCGACLEFIIYIPQQLALWPGVLTLNSHRIGKFFAFGRIKYLPTRERMKNIDLWKVPCPRHSFIQSNCCVIPGCCSFGIGKGSSVIYQTQKVHLPPMQLPSYSILCASFSASMISVTSTEIHRDVNCGHCCWWQAQAVWRWNKLKSRADKSSAHALTIYRHNDNKLESCTSLRASILWLE